MKNTIILCSLLLTAVGCFAMEVVDLAEVEDLTGTRVDGGGAAVMVLEHADEPQDKEEDLENDRPDAVQRARELFMSIPNPTLGDVRECFDNLHGEYIRTNHFLVSEDARLRNPEGY